MRPGYIGSTVVVSVPKERMTRKEYLKDAKEALTEKDYKMLLLAILDEDYYNSYDGLIRRAVDDYYKIGV
jgi:hypothetical protein